MQYAIEYDLYGEHRVRVTRDPEGGIKVERVGDGEGSPDLPVTPHLTKLRFLWAVVKDLDKKNRVIPLTKSEVENFLTKSEIKKLIKAGLLKDVIVSVSKDGKRTGSRACLIFTETARRYLRGKDEKVSGHVSGPDSASLGSLDGAGESSNSDGSTNAGFTGETESSAT